MKVIWKATEKEQTKRYQTALDFKNAIQEALRPSPSVWETAVQWVKGNSIWVIAITASLIAFVILLAILLT